MFTPQNPTFESSSQMSSSSSSPHELVKRRWLGFLIWQSIVSTAVYLLSSLLIPLLRRPLAIGLLSFLAFHLSLLLLSLSFFLLSSPCPDACLSAADLVAALLRVSLSSVTGDCCSDVRRTAWRAVAKGLFLIMCGFSSFLSATAVCGRAVSVGRLRLVGAGIGGAIFGLVYGVHYLYHKRWILRFPIIQRPVFYSFKMGLLSSLSQALQLSTLSFFSYLLLFLFLPHQLQFVGSVGSFILYQFKFYAGLSVISFCWELSHHLLQVVLTKRCVFAPFRGSAAAETNPSEWLLEVLEQSNRNSLLRYLACLDLCMVSESNVEPWRRAAFFEETGQTYRRVVAVCLRPLEHFTSKLIEGLEGLTVTKFDILSKQMSSPNVYNVDVKLHEAFGDIQLYAWCARSVAALTARSHSEDRYGVAQLTGCNVAVISTLLSALLAVEACMGKKTSSQPANLVGPASIRWATSNVAKHEGPVAIVSRKRGGILYSIAYAMADILRTSIYQIVSAFQAEMQEHAKRSTLEKNWIADGKPLYATRENIIQKLHQFLEYRAY
ncbi:hypothetical protein AXF42_Ash014072 [Apostasia shenzhenica]|uniref:Nucleoporin NDC1 n=1 Tax=Apostasia shenzhenica TaxID=1088818 RepID=A0A2I0A9D6_9ASPA|nr:hypothetical protein AXF42_Ash014072 [Apostasia shenzhenica]